MKRIIYGFLACLGITCYDLSSASELELQAIVPNHGGLTLQKSPVLYYFISEPTTLPVRFTLIESRTDHVLSTCCSGHRIIPDSGRFGLKIMGLCSTRVWSIGGL